MKQVLVTGGAGFIGSTLCESLLRLGYRVINVDNFNDYYNPGIKRMNIINAWVDPSYKLIEADIRNDSVLKELFDNNRIDTVIHLAALAGVRNSIEKPAEYADVDITGTVKLFEHSRRHNVKKFVFASSSSIYGNLPVPFNEDMSIGGQQSPYAAAKYAAEQFCRVYNTIYRIPTVCLRFFTVYGERQRPEMAIHKLTRLIDCGSEIQIYGDGSSYRDYTYVQDTVNGILAAIELDCDFEIFNLGSTNKITIVELVEMISRVLGKEARIKYSDFQSGDVECTMANIDKARRMLGYVPKMKINDGIQRFIRWYQEYKNILY